MTISDRDSTRVGRSADPPATPGDPSAPVPPSDGTPKGPEDGLLPNLRSLEAFDLQVEGTGAQRVLRFAAALGNVGGGPALVVPRGRSGCPSGQIASNQLVYLDGDGDGAFLRDRDRDRWSHRAGCMIDHPTHDHWHFDAMAAYRLRRPAETTPIVSSNKVSFCLRDNERVPGDARVERRAYYGECSSTTSQGISPGWADVYSADLDGQSLPLRPSLDGEVLCLDLEADPRGRLVESDETDETDETDIHRLDRPGRRRTPTPPEPLPLMSRSDQPPAVAPKWADRSQRSRGETKSSGSDSIM